MADDVKYKIGEIHNFTYNNAPVPPEKQYRAREYSYSGDSTFRWPTTFDGVPFVPGEFVDIFSTDGQLIAKYEVLETDDTNIKGKIIATYGHKRRKQPVTD